MRTPILLFSILSTLASACLYPRAADGGFPEPEFSYNGDTGPMVWHYSPNNTLCGKGMFQSPINISPDEHTGNVTLAKELKLEYPGESGEVEVTNAAHTVIFTPKELDKYTAVLEGKKYKLLQFHFHTPSEHRFRDESFPMEVHFVHKSDDGNLAVVGIFFNLDEFRCEEFLYSTTSSLNSVSHVGNTTTVDGISFTPIINAVQRSEIWTYPGSLTTPPCSEGVTWFVVENPLRMCCSQYKSWKRTIKFNSRPTQNAPGQKNLFESKYGEF